MLDLTNKTAKQKAQLKSAELAKVKLSKFKKDDFDIEIIGDIKEIEVNGQHGIELFAKVFKGKKQCGFGKKGDIEIERFRFFNPDILVNDTNGDISIEFLNEKTGEVEIEKLKEDPTAWIKRELADTIKTVAKDSKNIVKGSIGNTTSTFYDSERARIYSQNATWSTCRGASSGTLDRNNLTYFGVSTGYLVVRSIVIFDTAALGDSDTIDSATLSWYAYALDNNDNDGNNFGRVVDATPASDTEIVAGDFDQLGSTAFATDISFNSVTTGQYNTFTLNSSGISNISKTGKSSFGLREGHDVNNHAPVNSSYTYSRAIDSRPKLVVVHTTPVTGPANLKTWNGVAKANIKTINGVAIANVKTWNGVA